MNRTVLIIGTDHRFQMGSPEFTDIQHDSFSAFIEATAKANLVVSLAEENSSEALAEAEISESTVQIIANKLGLKHCHCDPDRKIRVQLKIQQENDLRVSAVFGNLTESAIQDKVEESFRIRERYWLGQLLKQNAWPTLFICGANHSLPFLDLLGRRNFEAILVVQDWGT